MRTIRRNFVKYERHGTSTNRNRDNSGRRRTARSQQNIANVKQDLHQNPHVSSRRNNVAVNQSAFNRITRLDLRYHPYRIQVRHALVNGDQQRRIAFCQWLIARPVRFMSDVIIVDEAAFHMNGKVNTWNVRQYAPRNNAPNFTYDVPNNREKVMVWAGLIGNNTIIGPYVFNQNVNGRTYLDMINQFVVPQLTRQFGQRRNGSIPRLWWMQDGAPAHRSRVVSDRLQDLFPNRVVSLNNAVEWPPRSPDLTPLDFFLWGYLKDKVYRTVPANILDLQNRITAEIVTLRRTRMVRRAVNDMRRRAAQCIAVQGAQV